MKYLLILFCIISILFSCATLKYVAPRPNPPVQTKGGVLFEYYAPSAKRVTITGEFNNWEFGNSEKAILMKKNEQGLWKVMVPLNPGRYKYKFVIDDSKWEKNPYGDDANDPDNNSLIVVE